MDSFLDRSGLCEYFVLNIYLCNLLWCPKSGKLYVHGNKALQGSDVLNLAPTNKHVTFLAGTFFVSTFYLVPIKVLAEG